MPTAWNLQGLQTSSWTWRGSFSMTLIMWSGLKSFVPAIAAISLQPTHSQTP